MRRPMCSHTEVNFCCTLDAIGCAWILHRKISKFFFRKGKTGGALALILKQTEVDGGGSSDLRQEESRSQAS